MAPRINTIHDYNQPRQPPAINRNCPGMTSIWPFSISSFSPLGRFSWGDVLRRIGMILILCERTGLEAYFLIILLHSKSGLAFIIWLAMDIVAFVFLAWCLSVIGDAQGDKIVFGARVSRFHFDAFLLFAALVHLLLVMSFGILVYGLGGGTFSAIWMGMWLLFIGVAWVARWEEAGPVSLV
ncbi:uncharacterized protein LTR77_007160 [Saxophila tyrrhenica]|uniref:Uncharacterized protein n=1 Tax=Saxophila tyrrhenica TaxID=1690608 RepID=A0AAV9P404_9PEZI|nr:hypothetical protein LTR77_007160 [Saxophila tyrrhenica]